VDGPTWRPAGTPDVADIADISAEVGRATPVGTDTSATDVRARLSRPRLDADLDTRLAVDAAGGSPPASSTTPSTPTSAPASGTPASRSAATTPARCGPTTTLGFADSGRGFALMYGSLP
jgi:hypothetical protein